MGQEWLSDLRGEITAEGAIRGMITGSAGRPFGNHPYGAVSPLGLAFELVSE